MKKKTLACCYTRFSTDNQNQSSTIGQLRSIKAYCERNNIELIDTYIDEAQSGTNMERTNFQRMLADAPTALWDTLVVYNMSRLSRSVKDTLIIKEEFKKMGKKILSVIENQEETPEGDFFNLITYGMNELFVKQFKRDTWRGLMTNALDCKAQGGPPLFGYSVNKDRKYVIVEEEAKIVRYVYKQVIAGSSYREIANALNKKGYTLRGRPFKKNFTDMLRNEKYTGVYLWNRREGKHKIGVKTNRVEKSPEEIVRIEGGMPAIIDVDTFKKVQEILDKRKKKQRGPKSKYLLTHLIECGICGHAYCGGTTWSGRTKNMRRYYRCMSHNHPATKCNCKDINMTYLDDYICKLMETVILNVDNADTYKEFINKYYDTKTSIIKSRIDELDIKKDELKQQSIDYASRLPHATDDYYVELTRLIGKNVADRTIIDKEYDLLQSQLELTIRVRKSDVEKQLRLKRQVYNQAEKKEVIHKVLSRIVMNNDFVDTYIDVKYLFQVNCEDNELILRIREPRDNLSKRYNYEQIDFTSNALEKGVEEAMKSINYQT